MKEIGNIRDLRLQLLMCIKNVGNIVEAMVFKDDFGLNGLYGSLISTAYLLRVDLPIATHAKISINENKYPIEYCCGSVRKYTAYSSKTNITQNLVQIIPDDAYFNPPTEDNDGAYCRNFYNKLPYIRERALQFTRERNWNSYDTPNNLVFALNSELAELCELFQWKGDDPQQTIISDEEWNQAAQEIADVLLFALKLKNSIKSKPTQIDYSQTSS
jgi:NTP pyrophosphatase (non-canonical NTP hydrolase)